METREIVRLLEEIGVLLELQGENPFKIRAYQSGARALAALEEDLDKVIAEERLEQVPGIGKALAGKITTLRREGRLAFYDELRAAVPAGLLEMLEIPGFGPKKIRKVREELGIETLAQLKQACESGSLAGLAGFGAKSVENIQRGIANREAYGKRHIWWEARGVALPILDGLRALPQVQRAELAGSFRRALETIGDLDFIAAADEPAPVMDWFVSRPEVIEITAHGTTKSSVRFASGLQADLRVVPDERFVFALHHFTGSKDHNVRMRQRALARGYSLSEWGIFARDEPAGELKPLERPLAVSGVREEADLFRALGLADIAPELREGTDEIERAEQGDLPPPLQYHQLRGTFHNHTRASDGTATLEELAGAAAASGLEYIGVADHSKASFQANGLDGDRLRQQVLAIRALNGQPGDRAYLLAGCEVDILKDGSLDLPQEVLRQLDYVVLSVHSSMSGMSEEDMTRRLIRALETDVGCLKILGHPSGRLLLRREPYPVNLRLVIDAAAANAAAIELNCNPWRMDMDWRLWRYAADRGVPCAINPDAHQLADLAFLEHGVRIARKAGLQPEELLNSRPLEWWRDRVPTC